jgi:hypothetical protein
MHAPGGRCRHSIWSARSVALAAVVGLAVLGLAACGVATGNADTPPADWHDITPPTGEQITSYAVSPDVPGLIVACIGDQTAHTSAAPMGSAHIWRTRDAGAHWQMLPTTQFYGGCEVAMPVGGHGTVFAENLLGTQANPPQFITVSHDAGDTWQTLATDANYPNTLQEVFRLLSAGVYRGGQLSSLGAIALGQAGNALPGSFFVSADDGRTWRTLDASADPLAQQGFFPTGLTPDYHSPGAWYRLMARSEQWFSSNAQGGAGSTSPDLPATVLEHSSDGGRTWTVLGTVGPLGPLSYGQSLAGGGSFSAMLATTPGQPDRLCAGFYPAVQGNMTGQQGADAPAAGTALDAVGTSHTTPWSMPLPPYEPPHDVALYGSDDSGATWRGATVAQSSHAAQPVVAMDAHGDCYTAASTGPDFPTSDELDQVSTTFWRLAPGPSAKAQQIARITRLDVSTLGVTDFPGKAAPRLLAVVYTPQPEIICQGNVCPTEAPHPPHLIWLAAHES